MDVLFQKIAILPPRRVFWLVPPPPSGNSSLARRGGGGGMDIFWKHTMLIITCLPCNGSDVMSLWIIDSDEVLATGSLTTC